jgi:hypothetical protein
MTTLAGTIDRRLLINYRVDAHVLRRMLPPPFRPQLAGGYGLAGICIIRLARMRPKLFPRAFGVTSENAAHRIAVAWDDGGVERVGVFIPRRDTSSWMNHVAAGRVVPGVQHRARFEVVEDGDRYSVSVKSDDGKTSVAVDARRADRWTAGSVFASIAEASRFFERGSTGLTCTRRPGTFDAIELKAEDWQVEALAVERAESSFFDDELMFPRGSIALDSALLMRGIEHEFHQRSQTVTSTGTQW